MNKPSLFEIFKMNPNQSKWRLFNLYFHLYYFYPFLNTKLGEKYKNWLEKQRVATITSINPQGCTACMALRIAVAGAFTMLILVLSICIFFYLKGFL